MNSVKVWTFGWITAQACLLLTATPCTWQALAAWLLACGGLSHLTTASRVTRGAMVCVIPVSSLYVLARLICWFLTGQDAR